MTAAVICNSDLLVSCDTATAHLAGGAWKACLGPASLCWGLALAFRPAYLLAARFQRLGISSANSYVTRQRWLDCLPEASAPRSTESDDATAFA